MTSAQLCLDLEPRRRPPPRLTKAQVDAGAEGWAGRLTLLRHYLSQECPA